MPRKKPAITDPPLTRASRILEKAGAADMDLRSEYASLTDSYAKLLRKFHKTLVISDSYEAERQEMLLRLEETTRNYRQLKEVALPICMYCKKIRSDDDYWQRLETFFSSHADIVFSHGICPDCVETAYNKMGLPREDVLPATGTKRTAAAHGNRQPAEDDALREMQALLRQRVIDGNPLSPEVDRFVEKYGKLLRRFNKTVTISDSYQSQLMELKSRLELMARTDLLTGLASRWEITARLDAEKSRTERHGKEFSIILGDIDLFKKINDTYGHVVGDKVLRAIADTLRASLRNEDICGRWGGEEFLIILPETDLHHAESVAKKLLKEVRQVTVPFQSHSVKATISLACGVLAPGMSIDDLITQVDDALYDAKATGRDRVVVAKGNRLR